MVTPCFIAQGDQLPPAAEKSVTMPIVQISATSQISRHGRRASGWGMIAEEIIRRVAADTGLGNGLDLRPGGAPCVPAACRPIAVSSAVSEAIARSWSNR